MNDLNFAWSSFRTLSKVQISLSLEYLLLMYLVAGIILTSMGFFLIFLVLYAEYGVFRLNIVGRQIFVVCYFGNSQLFRIRTALRP